MGPASRCNWSHVTRSECADSGSDFERALSWGVRQRGEAAASRSGRLQWTQAFAAGRRAATTNAVWVHAWQGAAFPPVAERARRACAPQFLLEAHVLPEAQVALFVLDSVLLQLARQARLRMQSQAKVQGVLREELCQATAVRLAPVAAPGCCAWLLRPGAQAATGQGTAPGNFEGELRRRLWLATAPEN